VSATPRRDSSRRVLSLDVFDTALTRASGPPEAVYLLLGNRLSSQGVIPCSPEVFARARARAEALVWRRAGGLDAPVRLHHFYQEVVRLLWLDEALAPVLVAAELDLESELLRKTPQAQHLLERHGKTRETVFVSDTYFDADFIEAQLQRHGLWPQDAVVFASSDFTGSKASGKLFAVVLETLGVGPQQVCHVGDNPRSDVQSPKRLGIRTVPLQGGRLNRYERLLAEEMWATGGTSAAFAGASRLARLSVPVDSPRTAAIRDVAAGVAAPFIVSYVLWLLHCAADAGLARLHFVARDGQVMAEVASRLVERLELDIDVRYLHASRAAVNLAATCGLDERELSWVRRDLPHLSPRGVVERFDIDWGEVAPWMSAQGIDPDAAAGSGTADRALDVIRTTSELATLALGRAEARRGLVSAYLEQEGLLDGSSCGIVDFGGVGSQMRALHTLVARGGGKAPRLFLVGIDQPANPAHSPPDGDWLDDLEVYLYDHRRGLGVKRARGFGTCVQMFCAADHGTVTGYLQDGDRVRPILDEATDDGLLDWGLPVVRRTISSFVEHLILDPDLLDPRANMQEAVMRAIDLFWSCPTKQEAIAWGSLAFEGAQVASEKGQHLATSYTWPFVIRGLASRSFPNLGWQHWYEGSLQLSPWAVRAPLGLLKRAYYSVEGASHPGVRHLNRRVRGALGRSRPYEQPGAVGDNTAGTPAGP
jgi:FMN phosphatase YigB (HAD superfamily)